MTVREAHPGASISWQAIGNRPRHPPDQPRPRRGGRHRRDKPIPRQGVRLGRALTAAMVIHILAAFALMPVAGHPYDLASLTSASGAWLRWGVPLFYRWKFGFDLSVLAVGSQGLCFVLQHLGMSGAAALSAAWKLPLVLADLLVAAILVDLGRKLRSQRPTLMATLWLISPVPLWVSAGHGQLESLTILAIVLSLDMLLRRRSMLAGVVAGLGIGIEYLPALVALIVIFWFYVSIIERRDVYRFVTGCAGALAFCFGPPLSTHLGRTSILGGLVFTSAATSHSGHPKTATPVGSSLWAIFDLSPGPLWLVAALSVSIALVIVLAHRARKTNSPIERGRLGILAAGGLLLCVTLFDPGVLPQFSDLVLGGLCIVGISVDLNPAVIILGPFLQLARGFLFVNGGSFQSYWYDMWATTGDSGWPFPKSLLAADWAARLGVVVVAVGLLWAFCRALRAKIPPRPSIGLVRRSSIVAGALGMAFLATWSLQPAFWQGVGSQGPATLAGFPSLTAFQRGTVSIMRKHAVITFSPQEVLAARESAVATSLELTVRARPLVAQTTANVAKLSRSAKLTLPDWVREKKQVHSLWVSILLGRPAWRSQARLLSGVPALIVRDHPAARALTKVERSNLPGRLQRRHREEQQPRDLRSSRPRASRPPGISSSEVTWVAPGWAVVTYDVPASMVSQRGRLTLALRDNQRGSDAIEWNGSSHVRWVYVSLRSGRAGVTIDGTPWHGLVTLPSPTLLSWIHHAQNMSIRGLPLKPRASVSVTGVVIGGRHEAIIAGGLAWPRPGVLDHTIGGPWLSALGIVDVVALLGGALVLGRWASAARTQDFPQAEVIE